MSANAVPMPVAVMAEAVSRVQHSPDWLAAFGDNNARTELLVHALCDALHPWGAISVPAASSVRAVFERRERDRRMLAEFTGHNHRELARKFGLSVRHVRRIVDPRKHDSGDDRG